MTGAMVINIFLFFQFSHEGATAVAALDESTEREVVFDPVVFRFVTSSEERLHCFPCVAGFFGYIRRATSWPLAHGALRCLANVLASTVGPVQVEGNLRNSRRRSGNCD